MGFKCKKCLTFSRHLRLPFVAHGFCLFCLSHQAHGLVVWWATPHQLTIALLKEWPCQTFGHKVKKLISNFLNTLPPSESRPDDPWVQTQLGLLGLHPNIYNNTTILVLYLVHICMRFYLFKVSVYYILV